MELNLAAALASLPAGTAFRIANETRPPGDYLFNTILPERNMPSYHVDAGSMTIRATMAGLVGMDSPYPPGGMVNISTFLEQTAKIANEVPLSEAVLRQMQEFMIQLALSNQPTTEAVQRQLLNFLDKVVIQPHIDRFEWLRGQALVTGHLSWVFNKKELDVDYGIPGGNFLANRTGTASYGGSASVFWSDVRALRRLLKNNVRAMIVTGTTADLIRDNTVNGLVTVNELTSAGGRIRTLTFRRLNTTNGQFSSDVGDTVTLIAYDGEGEVLDPTDLSQTIKVPFMTEGKILAIGNNTGTSFRVGDGATDNPDADTAIGYTHIAPTIEGGGRAGRWSNIFTPEHEPWSVRGRAVTNGLPVITNETLVAVASTAMTP